MSCSSSQQVFNSSFPDIISIEGHFPNCDCPMFTKYLVIGPMARYAEDLHLAMKVLTSSWENHLGLDLPVDLKTLRVFFIDNFDSFCGMRKTKPEIRRGVWTAARHLAQNGARVRQVIISRRNLGVRFVLNYLQAPFSQLSQDWVNTMFDILMSLFGEMQLPPLLLNTKDPEVMIINGTVYVVQINTTYITQFSIE